MNPISTCLRGASVAHRRRVPLQGIVGKHGVALICTPFCMGRAVSLVCRRVPSVGGLVFVSSHE